MNINERIAHIRKEQKLSLRTFGEKIGMSSTNVARIEKNERNVTYRTIKLLMNEFGYSEEWIRTGTGDKFPPVNYDEKIAVVAAEMIRENNERLKELVLKLSQLDESELILINNMIDGILNTK